MEVNRIAVIGSGTMGKGIAYSATLSGYEVTLHLKIERNVSHMDLNLPKM